MRVAVIGPVAPFRSGIARHTGALVRALREKPGTDVTVVSFSRQYPRALFPGEIDRDPDTGATDRETAFLIDSLNPLSWRRAVAHLRTAGPDLAVIPAWTFFTAPALGHVAAGLRASGIPVIQVVHNAEDHEAGALKRALSRYQLKRADAFVTHNDGLKTALRRLVPGKPVTVSPHPLYDDYPAPQGTLPRRAGLELLFFGIVRPYKGLDVLLRAVGQLKGADIRLTVAGEFWSDRAETDAMLAELGIGWQVELIPRYVSDGEAAELMHRADALVAPYRSATGSGVLALAQHFQKPVIASDIPGLNAAVTPGETGWLVPPGDPNALAETIRAAVTPAAIAAMAPHLAALRDRLTWAGFADAVLAACPR